VQDPSLYEALICQALESCRADQFNSSSAGLFSPVESRASPVLDVLTDTADAADASVGALTRDRAPGAG
jgi:hypothetical protein